MLQARVCEPLKTIIKGKLAALVKEEKREWLLDMWSVTLESMTQGLGEVDWERQANVVLVSTNNVLRTIW